MTSYINVIEHASRAMRLVLSSAHPRRRSCVSKRCRCGAVTLCGDRACRSAVAVAPCEFVLTAANRLRRSCVSKRSRPGAVRICLQLGEPSAEIVRVETLSLWRGANLLAFTVREWLSRGLRAWYGSCAPQLWLENGSLGVQKYHAKRVPAAPADLANFKYTQAGRALQLRIENRNSVQQYCRGSGSRIALFVYNSSVEVHFRSSG